MQISAELARRIRGEITTLWEDTTTEFRHDLPSVSNVGDVSEMMVMHCQVVFCNHKQADHKGIFDVISHHAKGVTAWHVCSYLHAYIWPTIVNKFEDMYGHEFERGEVTFGEYLDGLADSVHPEKGDLLAAVLLTHALGIHIAIIVKGGHFVNTKASNAKGDTLLFTACVQGCLVDTKRLPMPREIRSYSLPVCRGAW